MNHYGKTDYWDERYKRDTEQFDWYQRYQNLLPKLETLLLNKEMNILIVGAGNSKLSEELYESGYQNVISIDNCGVVIKQMTEKNKDKNPCFQYLQMDSRAMEFEDEQFELIIDKALLDCILCGESTNKNISKHLGEVNRVMKPNGVYMIISFGDPEQRLKYLEKNEYGWTVEHETIKKPVLETQITINPEDKDTPKEHYIYLIKKKGNDQNAAQEDQKQEDQN